MTNIKNQYFSKGISNEKITAAKLLKVKQLNYLRGTEVKVQGNPW